MSYYDHATAMAFKLDRWSEERTARNYELEAMACERRAAAIAVSKLSMLKRCVSTLRNKQVP